MTDANVASGNIQFLTKALAFTNISTSVTQVLVGPLKIDAQVATSVTQALVGKITPSVNTSTSVVQVLTGPPLPPSLPEEYPCADGSLWFTAIDGEPSWSPAKIWNGAKFSTYKMWNGSNWEQSCDTEGPPETPLNTYPTSVSSGGWSDNNGNAFADLPAFPAGTRSAIALVGTMRYRNVVLPTGWRLLGESRVGSDPINGTQSGQIRHVIAVCIDDVQGTESLRFNFTDEFTDSYNMKCYAYAYFKEGSPGTWNAVKGVEEVNRSYYNFTALPQVYDVLPRVWWQTGIVTAVYTSAVSSIDDVTCGYNGFMEVCSHPAMGASSGTNFYTRYLTGHPGLATDYIDTDSIGAYGQPNSTTWGFYWTPPV